MPTSHFSVKQHNLEYLVHWITRDHTKLLPEKVEAMHKIAVPKNEKALRSFMSMANHCQDS